MSIDELNGGRNNVLPPGVYHIALSYDALQKYRDFDVTTNPVNLVVNLREGKCYKVNYRLEKSKWAAWIEELTIP